jgi:DNA-binding GntR family transcriptional regulator
MRCLLPWAAAGYDYPVIDRGRPMAPYQQLAAIIRGKVESGELPRGSRLPSITALAAEYEVAQITVQKALGVLKDEGLITGIQGYGTFISEDTHPRSDSGD